MRITGPCNVLWSLGPPFCLITGSFAGFLPLFTYVVLPVAVELDDRISGVKNHTFLSTAPVSSVASLCSERGSSFGWVLWFGLALGLMEK